MTTTTKNGLKAGLSLAGIVAVLGLWPHAMPILDWLMKNAGVILEREQVQAVLAAIAMGTFLGAPLPHIMPAHWSPAKSKAWSGLMCVVAAFTVAWTLVPTRIGFVYAAISAVATPTVSSALMGVWYWLKPQMKPESLQP